jgi:hypothetical protein
MVDIFLKATENKAFRRIHLVVSKHQPDPWRRFKMAEIVFHILLAIAIAQAFFLIPIILGIAWMVISTPWKNEKEVEKFYEGRD